MIKSITNEEATKFYWGVQGKYRKQLYFPTHGNFYGYFEDEILKGIICVIEFKNKCRITCFLIDPSNRNKGIGNSLLQYVIEQYSNKILTAFTTLDSKNLFQKNNFKVIKEEKFNITFMERDINV